MVRVLLLAAWVCAAPLLGLAAGVARADLLLVVPAAVMVAALVALGGAQLGARVLALALTTISAGLLAVGTWGPLPGTVLSVSAVVVADRVMSFLRSPGREGKNGPSRA
ncbi:hypothetical protein [Nonomuraea sp. SYSU D8015]|uniref:hypothetical protein n=1 Tax=Nonomuraea sp. SYSU D8015 TaxID=2593644 RepID=UPI00166106E2|nr:hypothetical protein [Nonomuraea sp. SYSU D8015]